MLGPVHRKRPGAGLLPSVLKAKTLGHRRQTQTQDKSSSLGPEVTAWAKLPAEQHIWVLRDNKEITSLMK